MSQKKNNKNNKSLEKKLISFFVMVLIAISLISVEKINGFIFNEQSDALSSNVSTSIINLDTIPEYTNSPYVEINNNIPFFSESDYTTTAFETYSDLDNLGRCGVAYANICKEIMPAQGEKRTEISMVKPSGWKNAKYEGIVEGNYLYNRCHLIGYQLAGENANEKNLITGTRYFNVTGMLPFENQVADYIKNNPKNHVLFRVTPIFKDNNLVANGVEMEAYSIEDNGKSVKYNVFVYNVQPKITINYIDGSSSLTK